MKITFVSHAGERQTIDVEPEGSLMEAAIEADIGEIVAACGGNCSCCTCLVHVDEGWFSKTGTPSDDELELVCQRDDRQPTSRLSCQINLTAALDGLIVHTPEFQD